MGADTKANGTGFWRSALTPQFILTLALILAAMVTAWGTVDQHTRDCSVHHTAAQLDDSYVRRDVHDEQLAAIKERLVRIEAKLDQLQSKSQ
jgi:hypothetical protein